MTVSCSLNINQEIAGLCKARHNYFQKISLETLFKKDVHKHQLRTPYTEKSNISKLNRFSGCEKVELA